jgi:hypothetical protein
MFETKYLNLLVLFSYLTYFNCVSSNNQELMLYELKKKNQQNELTEAQFAFYNRIKLSKYVNNPYKHLNASQGKLKTKL